MRTWLGEIDYSKGHMAFKAALREHAPFTKHDKNDI